VVESVLDLGHVHLPLDLLVPPLVLFLGHVLADLLRAV